MWFSTVSAAFLGLASVAQGMGAIDRNSPRFTVRGSEKVEAAHFTSEITSAELRFVKNSGVCETTEGVDQYSGYISVGANMSMWFWFFEARNDAENAPLALWLNGGPGCSSMIGLFQEHGPCHFIDNETEPTLNPYSWNEYANMLYVDQPIGTGFSFGTYDVNSTVEAAPYVWTFLQTFFENFPKYQSRDFGLFTESYGGHYGPEFASYFEQQNSAIDSGAVIGAKINLVALGINNGWIDPERQYLAYATYSYENPYRQILDKKEYERFVGAWSEYCEPAYANCTTLEGQDEGCYDADYVCSEHMYTDLTIASKADFDVYDVRLTSEAVDPPETYVDYISRSDIRARIGATTRYSECDDTAYYDMINSGDDGRNFAPVLAEVIKSNITTLLWAGDADWICNWMGVYNATLHLEWDGQEEFAAQEFQNYTVNGVSHGQFKTVDNFSFLRVYEAGHEVPYYQPETALQVFKQIMQGQPLTPT